MTSEVKFSLVMLTYRIPPKLRVPACIVGILAFHCTVGNYASYLDLPPEPP